MFARLVQPYRYDCIFNPHASTLISTTRTMSPPNFVVAFWAVGVVAFGALCTTTGERQDIFTPSARFPCFRQPVLVDTSSTILAFAENRNVSACAPNMALKSSASIHTAAAFPNEVGSLQLRRSSDGGATWTPLQSLFVGNIDFYTAVHDAATNTTWLMLEHEASSSENNSRSSQRSKATTVVEVLQSRDHGASWSTLAPLHVDLPAPFNGGQFKPSVGHGIQMERSGRLMMSFVCTNTSAPKPSGDAGACPGCVGGWGG